MVDISSELGDLILQFVMATWTSPFRVSNFRLSDSEVLSSFFSKVFKSSLNFAGAPNENIVQNYLNIALLNVF